jgi:hypothetical protein
MMHGPTNVNSVNVTPRSVHTHKMCANGTLGTAVLFHLEVLMGYLNFAAFPLDEMGDFSFVRCLIVCELNHEKPLLIDRYFR